MFNNVGRKVQILAKVVCWVGIILSVISGIMLIVAGNRVTVDLSSYGISNNGVQPQGGVLPGILTIIIGSLVSWLGSLATYAIGEAAEYAEKH